MRIEDIDTLAIGLDYNKIIFLTGWD